MPGKKCSVLGCETTEGRFFRFPKDVARFLLCRLCFCFSDTLIDVFEEDRRENESTIPALLEDLLQVKVSKADDFPKVICMSCLIKLDEFKKYKDKHYKLKESFEKALHKLRKSKGEDMELDGSQSDTVPGDSEYYFESEDGLTGFEDLEEAREEVHALLTGNEKVEEREMLVERDHKCLRCGLTFEYRNLLLNHLNEHQEWPFQCTYCGNRYKKLINLNVHITKHSKYKPYECEHCGLRFRLKKTLFYHKSVHSCDKTFMCFICWKDFRREVNLNVHLWEHADIDWYICDKCGEGFNTIWKFNRHYAHHQKE